MSNGHTHSSVLDVRQQFNHASLAAPKPKPCYVTVRVTPEEKQRLETEAAGISISAHVRDRLFGEDVKPRRTRGRFPVKDYEALSRVLRALGKANLYNNLHIILLALEEQRVSMEPQLEAELRDTFAVVCQMREDLVSALGLQPRNRR